MLLSYTVYYDENLNLMEKLPAHYTIITVQTLYTNIGFNVI